VSGLTGKFFVDNLGDSFRTGMVVDEVGTGAYLVRYDMMMARDKDDAPPPGMALILVGMMLEFDFFDSREERDAYVIWIEKPPKPDRPATVVKLRS
jgi:hypothetical protein